MAGDLHSKKDSHMSLPVTKGMEFHLKHTEYKGDYKVGESYTIEVPVKCTSLEGDSCRFKQDGKIEVCPEDYENMPLEDLKKKIGSKEE